MSKGNIVIIIVLILAIFGGFYGCNKRNSFVELNEGVKAQWGQVDNQYKRRASLLKNMLKTVEAEANFEKSTLVQVSEARASATKVTVDVNNLDEASMQKYQQAQGALSSALSRLLVASENYPSLKSNAAFADLRVELEGTENRIAEERRKFNETAKEYNTAIQKFPGSLFASGFSTKAYFTASPGDEEAPDLEFNIK